MDLDKDKITHNWSVFNPANPGDGRYTMGYQDAYLVVSVAARDEQTAKAICMPALQAGFRAWVRAHRCD